MPARTGAAGPPSQPHAPLVRTVSWAGAGFLDLAGWVDVLEAERVDMRGGKAHAEHDGAHVRAVELVGVDHEVVEASEDFADQVAEQADPCAQDDRGLPRRT